MVNLIGPGVTRSKGCGRLLLLGALLTSFGVVDETCGRTVVEIRVRLRVLTRSVGWLYL